MYLANGGIPPDVHAHEHLLYKEDDVHVHPIILYACNVHVQCQGHGIGHNRSSWIRVKEQQGA